MTSINLEDDDALELVAMGFMALVARVVDLRARREQSEFDMATADDLSAAVSSAKSPAEEYEAVENVVRWCAEKMQID